jgi:hypothetical protein
MKKPVLLLLAALAGASLLHAAKITGGPKGGHLLDAEPLKAEFFVTDDRKVEVTFYDAALKPVAPTDQVVAVTAEPAGGRTAMELERTATGFLSKAPLPAGEPYRVVVQVRASAGAKPRNFRIGLVLSTCGECQRKEYACVCEGH